MAPTTRAALLLALAAASGLLFPLWLPVLAVTCVVGATLGDAWVARRPRAFSVTLPTTLPRAVPTPFAIEPDEPAPGRVQIRQPPLPDVRVLPETADEELTGTLRAARRGRHVLPRPATRSTGPLGLGAAYRSIAEPHTVIVVPDLPGARRLAAQARAGQLPEATRRRGAVGLGTEFERVREYDPDDDVRQINWRATARTGRPMTNEYRIDQDRDVICVLDAGRLMAAPIGDATLLDLAVDAACAVAATADALGDRAGALVFDDAIRRHLDPRRRGGEAVARILHDVEPTAAESDYRAAFVAFARRKRSTVVVFTDLLEEAAARPLLDGLPVVARRHAVIVASIRDPRLDAALLTSPQAVGDALAAAAAIQMHDARRRVAARIAALGVGVIDAAPASLGIAAVRAYLQLKSRARA